MPVFAKLFTPSPLGRRCPGKTTLFPRGSSSLRALRRVSALGALCCIAWATAGVARADQTTVTIVSSTAMLEFVRAASEAYGSTHSEFVARVTGGGSGDAMRALSAGTIDIAVSDVAPDPGNAALLDHSIAVNAFAIVTGSGAGVTSLTRAQLRGIFTGATANWKAVGGADMPIVLVGRARRSGVTSLVSQKLLDGAAVVDGASTAEATSTALGLVASTPGAVSVVALAAAHAPGLTPIAIDGAQPTDENVENGSYPLWAYEHLVTVGAPSTVVSRFIAFIASDRALLHRFGFIGVRELGPGALTP